MGPIEADIPLPPQKWPCLRNPIALQMAALEVGESFLLDTEYEWLTVRGYLTRFRPKRFSIRKIDRQGWRVWRRE